MEMHLKDLSAKFQLFCSGLYSTMQIKECNYEFDIKIDFALHHSEPIIILHGYTCHMDIFNKDI